MRVRAFLALRICARSFVLDNAGGFSQAAVALNGQRFDTAAPVVGDQCGLASLVDSDMARPRATGRLLIEERQFTGCAIDRKGVDRALLFAREIVYLAHGIKELAGRMDGEE